MPILRSEDHDIEWTDAERRLPVFGWQTNIDAISAFADSTPEDGEDPDFPAQNLLNELTHQRWQSQDTGNDVYLELFMGNTFETTNFVAFAPHQLGDLDEITIYGKIGGGDSPNDYNEIFEPTNLDDNRPVIFQFKEAAYTSILIKIVGSGRRKAACLYAGLLLRMPRSVKVDSEHVNIRQGLKPDVLSGFSESANFLGRLVRNEVHEDKHEFNNIDPDDWYNNSFLDVWQQFIAGTQPFFSAWAPDDWPDDVGFVWFTEPPIPTQSMVTSRFSLIMQTRGFA